MKSAAIAAAIVGVVLSTTPGRAVQIREPQPLDASQPVPYFIADGIGRTGYRPGDRELANWALAAWQRHAGASLRLVAGPESTALVRLYWANARDGQYGEMRPLVVGGRGGAAVYIRPDMDGLGPEIAQRAAADDLLRETHRLPDLPARARSRARPRAHRRVRRHHVLLRLRRRHRGVLRPLSPPAALARRHRARLRALRRRHQALRSTSSAPRRPVARASRLSVAGGVRRAAECARTAAAL